MENNLLFTIGFLVVSMVTGALIYGRIKFGEFLDKQDPMRELAENRLKMEMSEKNTNLRPHLRNPIQLSLAQALFRKAESQEEWFMFPKQERSEMEIFIRKENRK